ncbi:RNA polymerase sigma factor [Nocardioides sp. B-3]|uniref:RNA polymerase sigma factor n=1 Tax=Nocardioides sp. B-3 TaxID=2895565 RepID=UPI002153A45F|nr:sigma factor [Nocardioides sp. B-3]UUZ61321.1 hypothetical protein LP418_12475 [Nocardioides sp. B-3]
MRAINDGDHRLEELWDAHARRLHAYARRHADAADAEDPVAEAYLVALRRIDDVPDEPGEAFARLVVTVRKLAANHRRRAATRDQHWAQAVRDLWQTVAGASAEDSPADRDQCVDALAGLSEADRETLLLVAWEGLTPAQGCPRPRLLRERLRRAAAPRAQAARRRPRHRRDPIAGRHLPGAPMTDLMQRLTAARPTDADLDVARPAADRDRALAGIRARSTLRRARRRTPWLAAAAVAGLCAFPDRDLLRRLERAGAHRARRRRSATSGPRARPRHVPAHQDRVGAEEQLDLRRRQDPRHQSRVPGQLGRRSPRPSTPGRRQAGRSITSSLHRIGREPPSVAPRPSSPRRSPTPLRNWPTI